MGYKKGKKNIRILNEGDFHVRIKTMEKTLEKQNADIKHLKNAITKSLQIVKKKKT